MLFYSSYSCKCSKCSPQVSIHGWKRSAIEWHIFSIVSGEMEARVASVSCLGSCPVLGLQSMHCSEYPKSRNAWGWSGWKPCPSPASYPSFMNMYMTICIHCTGQFWTSNMRWMLISGILISRGASFGGVWSLYNFWGPLYEK